MRSPSLDRNPCIAVWTYWPSGPGASRTPLCGLVLLRRRSVAPRLRAILASLLLAIQSEGVHLKLGHLLLTFTRTRLCTPSAVCGTLTRHWRLGQYPRVVTSTRANLRRPYSGPSRLLQTTPAVNQTSAPICTQSLTRASSLRQPPSHRPSPIAKHYELSSIRRSPPVNRDGQPTRTPHRRR
ncbi:hypothetical protein BD414DRAFT_179123 [Trametes punicea]|nr:hypothetical protein BD414DRAFT_179123 [Trametes punicea]